MRTPVARMGLLVVLAFASTDSFTQTAAHDALRFDANHVDRTADPCSDFYQYVCGTWKKTHPIPPDRSAWDPYYELAQKNEEVVRGILEGRERGSGSDYSKVTIFYAACMDEAAIEQHGMVPLDAELHRIATIRTSEDSIAALAAVQTLGADPLFAFYPNQDLKDSEHVIATVDVGSLGMTDRDYYLMDDAETKKLRDEYRAHVTRMLEYSGVSTEAAQVGADTVVRLETEMARVHPTREQQRDPVGQYHKLTRAQLDKLTPGWPWQQYFSAVGAPPIAEVNVTSPESLRTVTTVWLTLPRAEQQAYLSWHIMHALAAALPAKPAEEDFHFYGTVLRGTQQIQPRWKRCTRLTNDHLGEAVGKVFVERHFSTEQKQRVLAQIRAIQAALRDDISTLSWMSEATKREALRKLDAFRIKVGYPDHWRDYSGLQVLPGDAIGNAVRANRFEFARHAGKIGRPVDRDEWFSLPQDVDGYQSASLVEIVFTAGFLQPPFFDASMDDAVNFGAVGRAMGHEFTHGFDDHGRKFDDLGNLRDWWAPKDAARFQRRTQCFADEYSEFVVIDDKKLNGRLTLGENIADNGGIRLAYAALEKRLEGKQRAAIEGLTPEQRFFLSFARTQCANVADATARNRLLTDPHAPGRWRVNGTLRNFPEFQKAFACKPSEPMVSPQPCQIW
jgi:endothelin-converting enzyme/putative endopeptidase